MFVFIVANSAIERRKVIAPSSMASTSLYLASMATGQNTTSKLASTSRIFSWIFKTAISHPPQEAAQYMANFGFHCRSCCHLNGFFNSGRIEYRPVQILANSRVPAVVFLQPKLVISLQKSDAFGCACPNNFNRPDSIPICSRRSCSRNRRRLYNSVQIVAVSWMTTRDKDCICPTGKSLKTKCRIQRPEHISRINRTFGAYFMRAVPAISAAR